MNRPWELHIRGDQWDCLDRHLYSTPGEHGAVLLCGRAEEDRRRRLVVHDVLLAQDSVDYQVADDHYRLSARFVSRAALRARREQLTYVAVHPHGGDNRVAFSPVDLASQERSVAPLLAATRAGAVGWLVTAPNAATGLMRDATGSTPIGTVVILGERRRRVLTPAPTVNLDSIGYRWQRQTLIYGDEGQRLLQSARVGIVGLGGGGAVLNDLLSSLGVGTLVHVDPDRVDPTNLPRLMGATRWDALEPLHSWLPEQTLRRYQRFKVDVARRVAKRNNPNATVLSFRSGAESTDAFAALTQCDYVFLAADTATARLLGNRLATQWLVPVTQIGAKVLSAADGSIEDIYAVSRIVGRTAGCLWCNGLISPKRLAEEAVPEAQREAQRYVEDVPNPSVKSLNALSAAWAVEDFRNWYTGIGSAGQHYVTNRVGSARLLRSAPRAPIDCLACGASLGTANRSDE